MSSASGGMREVLGALTSKDGEGRFLEERYSLTLAVLVAMMEANSEIDSVVMAVYVQRQENEIRREEAVYERKA